MWHLVIISALAAGLAGLAIKMWQDTHSTDARISWREYAIGMALICVIIAPLVSWIGWKIAESNQLTFTEYRNGWETAAVKTPITCTRDGSCYWDFDCDPYLVSYECNCDNKGNCSTCWRTEYHHCPYVDVEFNYNVQTTLGGYEIATHVFPDNPLQHVWRRGYPPSPGTISSAGVGDPPFWWQVKQRLDHGQPGPVTQRYEYKNYILASETSVLRSSSSDIADYKKANLLPDLQRGVQAFYHADKVHFVGFLPQNAGAWQMSLEYLNSELGSKYQGDIQVVMVKNDAITSNPDRYALALKAYWQNVAKFEHNVMSKNGMVILIGTTDGTTIAWTRAFTGMPLGNEKLLVRLREGLAGVPLSPSEVLVLPKKNRSANEPDGVLANLVLGKADASTRFKRVSMTGKDGGGGFLYLKSEIRLTSNQELVIFFVVFVTSCSVWAWASAHYDPTEQKSVIRKLFWKRRK